MIKSFATSHQAINLLNNGAFECGGSRLHHWNVIGSDLVRGNTYSIKSGDGKKFMSVVLSSRDDFTIHQTLGRGRIEMDFKDLPNQRRTLPLGYKAKELKTVRQGIELTLAFTYRVLSGNVDVSPYVQCINNGTKPTSIQFEGGDLTQFKSIVGSNAWRRETFKFRASFSIDKIGLSFKNTNSDVAAQIDVTDISLVVGYYDNSPYTGDPLLKIFPKNCVVMVHGEVCPEGFENVTDVDSLVRSGDDRGSDTHTVDITTRVATNGIIEWEGFNSKSFVTNAGGLYNPNVPNDPVDVPDDRGIADHQHNIEEAKSKPLGFYLRMCKKI